MIENKCTYCGKELRNKSSFSYGFPGVEKVFACDRHCCAFYRKFLLKWVERFKRLKKAW